MSNNAVKLVLGEIRTVFLVVLNRYESVYAAHLARTAAGLLATPRRIPEHGPRGF